MKPMRLIRLSLTNLKRRKLRSLLTIWAISVGIGAMVLLISFAAGLEKQSEKSFLENVTLTQLDVTPEKMSDLFGSGGVLSGDQKTFGDDDVKKIRDIAHVKAAFPQLFLPSMEIVFEEKTWNLLPQVTPVETIGDSQQENLASGEWWTDNTDNAIVLSDEAVSKLETTAEAIVGKTVKLETVQYSGDTPRPTPIGVYDAVVRGVLKKPESAMFFPGDYLAQGLAEKLTKEAAKVGDTGLEPGRYASIQVIVDETKNIDGVRKTIEDLGWFATGAQEMLASIRKGFFIMKIVLGAIGGVALFVALIGFVNSMLMAVLERTREIGILVALGASRRTILWLFLIESAWLGFFGAVLGIVGAYAIGQAIVHGVSFYLSVTEKTNDVSFITFSVGWLLVVATVLGSVLVTIWAGSMPARRAAKQDPVNALRHE